MDGIKGLLSSKKAIAGGLLMIASTVLVITGKMDVPTWKEMNLWLFGTYAAAETANGVAAMVTKQTKKVDASPYEKSADDLK